MTRFENLAHFFPLHIQRIAELTEPKTLYADSSISRWQDLAGCFLFASTTEGHDYWWALAMGCGVP